MWVYRKPAITQSKVVQDSLGFWIPTFRIPGTRFWIPGQWNLDSGYQSFAGFRIPWAELRIPKPRIPDSTSNIFPNSGIGLPNMGRQLAFYGSMEGNPDSGMRENFSCGKFGVLGFGIRNAAQGIRTLSNDWDPESKFQWQRPLYSTKNSESTAWNPESKTVLDPHRANCVNHWRNFFSRTFA